MHDLAWLRAGIFGLWASGVTAAGIIGMQKWQGTLMYLINNPMSDYLSLAAVVLPAATFGLLSFPVSYVTCLLLGYTNMTITLSQVGLVVLLWVGATVLDLFIAAVFVLSRDAIVYEEIISLPLLVFSGLFALPENMMRIVDVLEWVIPISLPIQWILQQEAFSYALLVRYGVSNVLMLVFGYFVMKYIIQAAKQTGQFGGL